MKWKIFYGDGSVVDDSCPIEDVPATDVQVILVSDETCGRLMLCRVDFYIWKDGTWFGTDNMGVGVWDYLFNTPGWKKVLCGRYMTTEAFNAIYQAAKRDCDMPQKSKFTDQEKVADRAHG